VADIFIGALVGSALTVLVQWFIGPQVERRVRAQERWEQFLIEFAALIDGTVKQAHDAARLAWRRWELVQEFAAEQPADQIDPERIEALNKKHRDRCREALEAWRESLVRPAWLAARIQGNYAVADDEVRMFATRWMLYEFEPHRWTAWDDVPTSHGDGGWSKTDDARREVSKEIENLSVRIGAPVGVWQRIRSIRRQRREQREKKARDTKQADGPSA